MKKIALFPLAALILALTLAPLATAQQPPALGSVTTAAPTYATGSQRPLSLDTAGNLRVIPSAPAGTQDVNTKQVNGATVNVGTGAAGTGTQRVTTSTDSTIGTVTTVTAVTAITNALPVGANVIGKTSIDQTTPGTTNKVDIGTNGTVAIGTALPAGTALIGKVGIDQTTVGSTNAVVQIPSAVAAVAIAPTVSGALQSGNVLLSAAGNLYTLSVTITTVSGYLMVFDATSAPGDGAVTPKVCQPVNSNGTNGAVSMTWGNIPLRFATGITAVFSSTGCFTKTASATAVFSAQVQ